MYDSHSVYLHVLWIIYMYKFSRCHVVVFHGFFVPFTEFRQKLAGFRQKTARNSPRRFSKKTAAFIGETGRIFVFPVFTVPPSSPMHFGRFFHIFTEFCRIFQKSMGSVRSGFPYSAEFSNTGWEMDGQWRIRELAFAWRVVQLLLLIPAQEKAIKLMLWVCQHPNLRDSRNRSAFLSKLFSPI
jgi:hypothetical protein